MKLAASRALITARKGLCQKAPQPPAVQSKMAKNPLYDHEAAVFTAQDAVTRRDWQFLIRGGLPHFSDTGTGAWGQALSDHLRVSIRGFGEAQPNASAPNSHKMPAFWAGQQPNLGGEKLHWRYMAGAKAVDYDRG